MNEPQTLREYLNRPVTSDEAETGGRWERILIKHNDPILDAHIIRTCPTCGGSVLVPGPSTLEFDDEGEPIPGSMDMEICPDCADAPVWVIAPEAWEKAARLLLTQRFPGQTWDGKETLSLVAAKAIVLKSLDELAQALLPRARRAKAVGHICGFDVEFYPSTADSRYEGRNVVGDTIAILHNEQEKEHE